MLAYIGEKMYAWSDPARLDPHDVVDTVALYYLTRSFASSVLIYHQARNSVTSKDPHSSDRIYRAPKRTMNW